MNSKWGNVMVLQQHVKRLVLTSLLVLAVLPVMAQTDRQKKMLDQLDQLDRLDHLEFVEQIEYANSCIRARRFDCAETQITKAAKTAGNPQDKRALAAARESLATERKTQQAEQVAEERERARIVAAEARRQAEQEAAERRQAEREASANTWRALGAITTGALVGNASRGLSAEQQQRLVKSSMQGVMEGNMSEFNATSNQVSAERQQSQNAQLQAQREQRFREETAARAQRQQEANVAAARLGQENERQRVAQLSRSQSQASAQYAQVQQNQEQKAREEQARREEESRQKARDQAIAKAAADKAAAEKAIADKAAAIARKEQREAEKKAEAEAKLRAEDDYLKKLASGTRLVAKNCYGEQHVMGALPRIKPELVGCIDMHYRAYCPGTSSPVVYRGLIDTMVGMGTGCFGDTSKIEPKLACKAEEIRVEVAEARRCKS